jgi:hypothetical protein
MLFSASLCRAGYEEYALLDPTTCSHFTLTTDAPPPDPTSADASDVYRTYIGSHSIDWHTLWGLFDHKTSSQYWADCNWQPNTLSCAIVGGTPFKGFTCPLGSSDIWSRTCKSIGGRKSALKIYSVDTAEYELGGEPFTNRFYIADKRAMDSRCKKTSRTAPTAP